MRMQELNKFVRPTLLLVAIGTLWIGVGCTGPRHESAKMTDEAKPREVRIDWKFDAPPEKIWARLD